MTSSLKRTSQSQNDALAFGAVVLIVGVVVVVYGASFVEMVQGIATFSSAGLIVVMMSTMGLALAVILPLLLGEDEPPTPQTESPLARLGTPRQNRALEILYAEKGRLLRAIRDLDFDYDLGKLADDAYAEQRVLLIRQAAAVIAKIEALESEIVAQQERIEAALAAFRQTQRGQA